MPEVPCRPPKGVDNREPVIVVSGPPGSGKSTYARRLAQDFCLDYKTTGAIFRGLARSMGLSLEELSRLADEDPRIDLTIDRETIRLASGGGVVIDSHLAGWVLSGVADVRVLVTAPLPVRLERIASRDRADRDAIVEETLTREYSQWERYLSYYGYDTRLTSSFDLVVDTSVLGIEEVYRIIRLAVELKLERLGYRL